MSELGKTIALIRALGTPTDAQVISAVGTWLDDHPEATTTVEDGAISYAKLDSSLKQKVDDVPALRKEIYGDYADITANFTFVDGKRIRNNTGAYQGGSSYANFKANQNFVSIEGYSEIRITMLSVATADSSGLAFYSAASEASYLSGVQSITRSNGGVESVIQIPEGAKYVRTTYWKDASLPEGAPAFSCVVAHVGFDERISALETEEIENQKARTAYKEVYSMRSAKHSLVIANMQSGHGFTNPLGTGNAPTDDTVDYIFGSQSVKFDHAGQAQVSSTGIDLRNSVLTVTLKIDEIATGEDVWLYLSNDASLTSYRRYTLFAEEQSDQFSTGIWATVAIDVDFGAETGTPNMSSIKYIRVRGSAAGTVFHIQSIGYRKRGNQKPCISFTFDDGWSEQMDGAKILGKYNIPATAYIFKTSQLTLAQLKSLKYDYGWDIEMHGSNTFPSKTEEELVAELTELQAYIRGNGLGRGNHIAYPGGKNNQDVVNIVSRFCDSARTISHNSSNMETIPSPMPYNLRAVSSIGASGTTVSDVKKYIDTTVALNGWLILVFHRIGDTETSMFCSASDLEAIADYAVKSGADIKTVADMWERN